MNVIDYNPWGGNTTTTSTTNVIDVVIWHKPEGRGRHFRRKARGLARRLRLHFVRETRWEQSHPESLHPVRKPPTYGPPWTSDNALADFSFACTCHKRERYDRRRGR